MTRTASILFLSGGAPGLRRASAIATALLASVAVGCEPNGRTPEPAAEQVANTPPVGSAGSTTRDSAPPADSPASAATRTTARPPVQTPAAVVATTADSVAWDRAARVAWAYVDGQYQPATGLVNSVIGYPYGTVWDIASGVAALYCANQLDLLADADYDRRTRRLLRTLRRMPLYQRAVFNKNYNTRTGAIAGRNDRDPVNPAGFGYSALDIGRLLLWLKIVAIGHPQYAAEIDAVVARIDLARVVNRGYLQGGDTNRRGVLRTYVEGRLGYEQYSASGYFLWGATAEDALDLRRNAREVEVLGVPVLADRRGLDRLTSEPFILLGLETGWSPEIRELAGNLLAAQRARYQQTGILTVVSEDAVPVAPHYFYYYNIYSNGRAFAVDAQGRRQRLEGPRWISTKAAFAWHALLPGPYTASAVRAVRPSAHSQRGWSSGVYERSRRSTGAENINTNAVVLEAALFRRLGHPLLLAAPVAAEPGRTD